MSSLIRQKSWVSWALSACALAFAACGDDGGEPRPVSQMLVTFDADPAALSLAQSLRVRVYGGGSTATVPDELVADAVHGVTSGEVLRELVIALAPKEGDARRRFRVVAELHTQTIPSPDSLYMQLSVRGAYVEGETFHPRLFFDSSCANVTCDDRESCLTNGVCSPNESLFGETGGACVVDADCADEVSCTHERCFFGQCVQSVVHTDCGEGSCDPSSGCSFSPRFLCENGEPVVLGQICDGTVQCAAHEEDERNCKPPRWVCKDSEEEIEARRVCDGTSDCANGSDEASCGDPGQYSCPASNALIPASAVCNGVVDCSSASGSDESDERCEDYPNVYVCPGTSTEISVYQFCDGVADCGDGSDEASCEEASNP